MKTDRLHDLIEEFGKSHGPGAQLAFFRAFGKVRDDGQPSSREGQRTFYAMGAEKGERLLREYIAANPPTDGEVDWTGGDPYTWVANGPGKYAAEVVRRYMESE